MMSPKLRAHIDRKKREDHLSVVNTRIRAAVRGKPRGPIATGHCLQSERSPGCEPGV
jgi:hypothetical protein